MWRKFGGLSLALYSALFLSLPSQNAEGFFFRRLRARRQAIRMQSPVFPRIAARRAGICPRCGKPIVCPRCGRVHGRSGGGGGGGFVQPGPSHFPGTVHPGQPHFHNQGFHHNNLQAAPALDGGGAGGDDLQIQQGLSGGTPLGSGSFLDQGNFAAGNGIHGQNFSDIDGLVQQGNRPFAPQTPSTNNPLAVAEPGTVGFENPFATGSAPNARKAGIDFDVHLSSGKGANACIATPFSKTELENKQCSYQLTTAAHCFFENKSSVQQVTTPDGVMTKPPFTKLKFHGVGTVKAFSGLVKVHPNYHATKGKVGDAAILNFQSNCNFIPDNQIVALEELDSRGLPKNINNVVLHKRNETINVPELGGIVNQGGGDVISGSLRSHNSYVGQPIAFRQTSGGKRVEVGDSGVGTFSSAGKLIGPMYGGDPKAIDFLVYHDALRWLHQERNGNQELGSAVNLATLTPTNSNPLRMVAMSNYIPPGQQDPEEDLQSISSVNEQILDAATNSNHPTSFVGVPQGSSQKPGQILNQPFPGMNGQGNWVMNSLRQMHPNARNTGVIIVEGGRQRSAPLASQGIITEAHETMHLLNGDRTNQARQKYGNLQVRNNMYAVQDVESGKIYELMNPNVSLSRIARFVPQTFRTSRYNTYLTNPTSPFAHAPPDMKPTKIMDELTAYKAGLMSGLLGNTSQMNGADNGPIEFLAYLYAMVRAIDQHDPGYWSTQSGGVLRQFVIDQSRSVLAMSHQLLAGSKGGANLRRQYAALTSGQSPQMRSLRQFISQFLHRAGDTELANAFWDKGENLS